MKQARPMTPAEFCNDLRWTAGTRLAYPIGQNGNRMVYEITAIGRERGHGL